MLVSFIHIRSLRGSFIAYLKTIDRKFGSSGFRIKYKRVIHIDIQFGRRTDPCISDEIIHVWAELLNLVSPTNIHRFHLSLLRIVVHSLLSE